MRTFRLAAVLGTVALVVCGLTVRGQQGAPTQSPSPSPTPANPGAISGVVIDAITQKPIAGAIVRLGAVFTGPINFASQPPRIPGQLTDDQGRFIFTDVPANTGYEIAATKIGYFDGVYGIASTAATGGRGGTTARRVSLSEGQWFKDARIELGKPGAISGVVTDETNEPLVGVRVRLYSEFFMGGVRRIAITAIATTDDRGRYRFASLRPGRFVVAVSSVQDAVPASLSTFDLAGTTAQAVADQEASGRDVPIRRDPALAIDPAHRLMVTPETVSPPPSASGQPRAYPTTFHPSTRIWSESTVVELTSGGDAPRIDIQVRPVPVFKVRGRLDGPPDAIGGMTVRLTIPGAETAGRGAETATALTAPDGSFVFLNVPEGTYQLLATRAFAEFTLRGSGNTSGGITAVEAPGSRFSSYRNVAVESGPPGLLLGQRTAANARHTGRQTVTVRDRDLSDLVSPMDAGIVLKGQLVFDLANPDLNLIGLNVEAQPADGDPLLMRSAAPQLPGRTTKEFEIGNLLAGKYVLRTPVGAMIMTKSITWNGKDYTNSALELSGSGEMSGIVVTLTDKGATVNGVIRDRAGQPIPNSAMILFPVEQEQWTNFGMQFARIRSSVASAVGAYSLRFVPEGEYYAVAVPADQTTRWRDPAFLDAASRVATRIKLTWSETKTNDLVLQVIK